MSCFDSGHQQTNNITSEIYEQVWRIWVLWFLVKEQIYEWKDYLKPKWWIDYWKVGEMAEHTSQNNIREHVPILIKRQVANTMVVQLKLFSCIWAFLNEQMVFKYRICLLRNTKICITVTRVKYITLIKELFIEISEKANDLTRSR